MYSFIGILQYKLVEFEKSACVISVLQQLFQAIPRFSHCALPLNPARAGRWSWWAVPSWQGDALGFSRTSRSLRQQVLCTCGFLAVGSPRA